MRRTLVGWFFAVTGFLACPCHLVVTLPLAAVLLSGTALGGWIAGHQGAILAGASMYFIGALAGGAILLLPGKGVLASTTGKSRNALGVRAPRTAAVDCCKPTELLLEPPRESLAEQANTVVTAGGASRLEPTRH